MKTILFVDDDLSIKFIVDHFRLFHGSSYRIAKFVSDGLKALEALEQRHFDIVIADIKMPVMDGISLIRKMRERNDETFVIIESTYREFRLAQEALRYRAVDYIEKPLTEQKLKESLGRVDRLIERREKDESSKGSRWFKHICHGLLYDESIQTRQSLSEWQTNKKEILTDLKATDESGLFISLWEHLLYEKKYSYNDRVFMKFSASKAEKAVSAMVNELKRLDFLNHDTFILKLAQIISENITSNDLITCASAKLELSKDYISRTFRQKTGMTLKDYIILRKVDEAQTILSRSNKKVYEISDYLGYSTVDYFTKIFKRMTGETPTQYRRQFMV